jgi:glutaredoxin
MRQICMVVALLAAVGAASAGDLYRWVDKQGVVHYGDYPKEEDAERVKLHLQSEGDAASGVTADIPYEARMVAAHFPVTLYVFEGCDDLCKQSLAYLKKRKIPYTEHTFKTQADFEDYRKKMGIEGLPSLTVGSKLLTGFHASQWDDELDAAGYPKAP